MHRARFCFNPIPTWYAVQDLGCIGIQGRRYSFRILTVPGLGGRVRCESLNSFEQKGFQCTSECAECASLLDCKITQPTHIQAQLLWCLPACLFFVGILADQYVKWMDEQESWPELRQKKSKHLPKGLNLLMMSGSCRWYCWFPGDGIQAGNLHPACALRYFVNR